MAIIIRSTEDITDIVRYSVSKYIDISIHLMARVKFIFLDV